MSSIMVCSSSAVALTGEVVNGSFCAGGVVSPCTDKTVTGSLWAVISSPLWGSRTTSA